MPRMPRPARLRRRVRRDPEFVQPAHPRTCLVIRDGDAGIEPIADEGQAIAEMVPQLSPP